MKLKEKVKRYVKYCKEHPEAVVYGIINGIFISLNYKLGIKKGEKEFKTPNSRMTKIFKDALKKHGDDLYVFTVENTGVPLKSLGELGEVMKSTNMVDADLATHFAVLGVNSRRRSKEV